jgi:PAS domain S-box-containing protein
MTTVKRDSSNENPSIQQVNEELAASNEELQASNEELMAMQAQLESSLEVISDREQQIRALVESAPFPIAVYIGKEMRIAQANKAVIEVWGKGDDVIGKTYFELLPELEEQNIYPQLDAVYETGVPFHIRNQQVNLLIGDVLKEFYFNYSFTPLLDKSGEVYGIMNTAADVTDLYLAKKQVEYSEENFRNMILQAPVAMCLLKGPDFVIELVNKPMMEIWGKPVEHVMNKPVFDALPDAREQGLEAVMTNVYRTGDSFYASEQPVSLIRHGHAEIVYQNFVYQAYRDTRGKILGVLAISVNVSEQVTARLELQRTYEQIQLSKEAAQLGTFDMDLKSGTMEWDDRCRALFGINHQKSVSYEEDFLKGLHPDDREMVADVIKRLFDSNSLEHDYDIAYRTIGAEDNRLRWVRAKGKVYFEDNIPVRFIGSVMDITTQKENELRLSELAEKQARLAAIVNSSDDIIISKSLGGIITSWNPAAERSFGYTAEEVLGHHISIIIPNDRLQEEEFIISQIRNGQKVDHFDTVRMHKSGRELQLSLTISPVISEHGEVIGASKIGRDISAQLTAQQSAQKYTERLEIMNMVMGSISEELDLNKILQKVTDATTNSTGAKFGAFFYNKTDDQGESYMLYTLSGAPREAFERFGMPRNTAVFHPTFAGQSVLRSDDITKDPRYGKNDPHFGMPSGHLPVVSYLAVPVVSRSGKVIGGLFFGHPDPGKFTEEHEMLVSSIAAQAAISLDNAKLFEEVKALNDKKDEFIGLASHELKTPLTSINGYLQVLRRLVTDSQHQKFLDKAMLQVSKLTSLVSDLLDVSKIEAGKLKLTIADFNLKEVTTDAIELIQQSTTKHDITFQTDLQHCRVAGDAQRIEQVVINLLSNAIKYSPAANLVEVELREDQKNVLVSIRDFGFGIEAEKAKHIFTRFYRIDEVSPNISGLGIGLYLSHEIITRHNGKIWVESQEGEGSTFYFSLPKTIVA